jgi:hypothetical protein
MRRAGADPFEGTVMLASGTLKLVLAVLWTVAGVAILVADPPSLRFRLGDTRFSAGWVALLLGAYNGARWWGVRSADRRRRAAEEMQRHRPPRRPPGEPEPDRNPDFIFDDPPPPPEKPV